MYRYRYDLHDLTGCLHLLRELGAPLGPLLTPHPVYRTGKKGYLHLRQYCSVLTLRPRSVLVEHQVAPAEFPEQARPCEHCFYGSGSTTLTEEVQAYLDAARTLGQFRTELSAAQTRDHDPSQGVIERVQALHNGERYLRDALTAQQEAPEALRAYWDEPIEAYRELTELRAATLRTPERTEQLLRAVRADLVYPRSTHREHELAGLLAHASVFNTDVAFLSRSAITTFQKEVAGGEPEEYACAQAVAKTRNQLHDYDLRLTQLPGPAQLSPTEFPSVTDWLKAEWSLRATAALQAGVAELPREHARVCAVDSFEGNVVVALRHHRPSERLDPQEAVLAYFQPALLNHTHADWGLALAAVPTTVAYWLQLTSENYQVRSGAGICTLGRALEGDTPELYLAALYRYERFTGKDSRTPRSSYATAAEWRAQIDALGACLLRERRARKLRAPLPVSASITGRTGQLTLGAL